MNVLWQRRRIQAESELTNHPYNNNSNTTKKTEQNETDEEEEEEAAAIASDGKTPYQTYRPFCRCRCCLYFNISD